MWGDNQLDDVTQEFWYWFGTWQQITNVLFSEIGGYTDMLRRDELYADLPDEARRLHAEKAFDAFTRLRDAWMIVSDYLRLQYGRERVIYEAVHLTDVLAQVHTFLESMDANVEVAIAHDLPPVGGDPRWLLRAILGSISACYYQTTPFRGQFTHVLSADLVDDALVLLRIHTKPPGSFTHGPSMGLRTARLVVEQLGGQLIPGNESKDSTISITLLPWKEGRDE